MARAARSRSEPERGGTSSLGDALNVFLHSTGLAARLRDTRVFDTWTETIGPKLACHVKPVRFDEGELVVEVSSAAHLNELKSFTGDAFRRQANERLVKHGHRATIRRVVFKLKR
jgi:hypothetical protein